MPARKTVDVSFVREKVNSYLRYTDRFAIEGTADKTAVEWKGIRYGQCALLETILHETGNYKGFGYVTPFTVDESSRHYN